MGRNSCGGDLNVFGIFCRCTCIAKTRIHLLLQLLLLKLPLLPSFGIDLAHFTQATSVIRLPRWWVAFFRMACREAPLTMLII